MMVHPLLFLYNFPKYYIQKIRYYLFDMYSSIYLSILYFIEITLLVLLIKSTLNSEPVSFLDKKNDKSIVPPSAL